ncbi:ABC 3 transport family protein [Filifactor alocis ATCC 35896]|uniref:ABC 3 transport family protein n=1 Tax=Filifactor alocis (strain ATCC 35896 / CCUG 47790 / D40 B5) TaxID=546269 RepID=D6GQC1_FILAD|nr:metal ABC transporter permease [Filifactor alocis]EFE28974.1 ABC 3 transport family protein [Filifactor alocis ATCC 35896]
MIQTLIEMIQNDFTFRVVSFGSLVLGMISGALGCFAVLRKQSLIGDAISHCTLPGIAIAFLITNSKNIEVLLFGALLSGLLSMYLITTIASHSKLKFDASLALVLSVLFGIGIVFLTYIQKNSGSHQAGLEKFIFGQASSLLKRDVRIMIITGIVLFSMMIVFWKEFKLVTFDPVFAQTIGIPSTFFGGFLSLLMVLGIVIGLQTVGVILMSALLISPASAARQWTDKLSVMVVLSSLFGGMSGVLGTMVSSYIPGIPTGPTIVAFMSIIVLGSLLFAPRGIIRKWMIQRKNHAVLYQQLKANSYEKIGGERI